MRDIWVDYSSVDLGSGLSKDSPLSYPQVRNYFNPDVGDACPITPANNDILNCIGMINLISSDTVFSIKRVLTGKITIKSYSDTDEPWKIDTIGNTSSLINLFKNVSNYYIKTILCRDFVLCQNNDGIVTTILTNLSVSSLVNVDFKNMMVIAKSHLDVAARANTRVSFYGYTISCNKLYLIPSI